MHVDIDDTPFERLDDVPELIRRYAEISDDEPDDILSRSNAILKTAVQYDSGMNKPIYITRAFERAVKHLKNPVNKPVNDGFVNDTKLFFALAVAGGYTTCETMRTFMKDNVDYIEDLAKTAKAQRITNDERRKLGKQLRKAKKAIQHGDGPTDPLPSPLDGGPPRP